MRGDWALWAAMLAWGCGASSEPGKGQPPVTSESAFVLVTPPSGQNWTSLSAISHDGQVVAGTAGVPLGNTVSVYRWSAAGGPNGKMTWFEPPGVINDPGTDDAITILMKFSADSTALLGAVEGRDTNSLFLWNQESGVTDLGSTLGGVVGPDTSLSATTAGW